MSIVRVSPRSKYVVIDRRTTEDRCLSFGALGLLTYLLGQSDNWTVRLVPLATSHATTVYAVRKLLVELAKAGYAQLLPQRAADGKLRGSEWVIYEHPATDMTKSEMSASRDRHDEIPEVGESDTLTNSKGSNEEQAPSQRAHARGSGTTFAPPPSEPDITHVDAGMTSERVTSGGRRNGSGPAVAVYREVYPGVSLSTHQVDLIDREAPDPIRWRAVCEWWRDSGYRPQSIPNMLDKYREMGATSTRVPARAKAKTPETSSFVYPTLTPAC